MKEILYVLFGHKKHSANNANVNDKVYSTFPNNRPSEDEWYKEFKVSMLYGRQPMKNY